MPIFLYAMNPTNLTDLSDLTSKFWETSIVWWYFEPLANEGCEKGYVLNMCVCSSDLSTGVKISLSPGLLDEIPDLIPLFRSILGT